MNTANLVPDDRLEVLKCSVVEIKNTTNQTVSYGTGVIVSSDGFILTCYHVISDEKGKVVAGKPIHISFPFAPAISAQARLIEEYCNQDLDIAVLQIQDKVPEGIRIAHLSEEIDSSHKFTSFGFRKPRDFFGLNTAGEIRGRTFRRPISGGSGAASELIQLYSEEIGPGMSGAPVLDIAINRVVGIISDHYVTQGDVDKHLSFAIPIKSILQVWPELNQKNAGPRILEFAQKICAEGLRRYEAIDELFVSPLGFDRIKSTLEKKRLVIITGPRESGKTYMAMRLLWDYFNKGFYPDWVKGQSDS